MGDWCSSCSPDDGHRYEGDDKSTNMRDNQQIRADSQSDDGNISPDDDYGGYDGNISDDEDSKSISSKALTDQDIENAYDGWRKAVESGNETLATFHFEENPNVDMFEYHWNNGDSSLHVACKQKRARLVFFLLTQGASVNEQNMQNQNTPLHEVVINRDEKIIDLLLKWDADPNVMNKDKETPISISSQYRDQTIYRMLAGINEDEIISTATATGPNLNRFKTNADRFAALQVTAEMLKSQNNADQHVDDILNNNTSKELHDVIANRKQTEDEEAERRESELRLKTNIIAMKNPFTPIGRRGSKVASKIVKDHLKQKPLPKLEAWLEKRKPGGVVPTYQKRWIVVKGAHILWSSKQRSIINDADRKERKKFNGAIHLMTIEAISLMQTTNNNKFIIKAKDAKKGSMREYVFRCTNKRERDFWVQGLKEHKKQYQTVLSYLGK